MTTVRDIYGYLDQLAPFDQQMEWDNSGLILGAYSQPVRRAAVCLDVPGELPELDLVVSHHPVIFQARRQFTNPLEPAMLMLRRGIAAIGFHTNYDVCPGGVHDILAARLGLHDIEVLPNGVRIGRIEPASIHAYAQFIKHALGAPVRSRASAGAVQKIAVCGGSGCSFLPEIYGKADAFVTGDAGHHDFLEAAQNGVHVFAAGHWHTEILAIAPLLERLRGAFPAVEWIDLDEECEKTT